MWFFFKNELNLHNQYKLAKQNSTAEKLIRYAKLLIVMQPQFKYELFFIKNKAAIVYQNFFFSHATAILDGRMAMISNRMEGWQ